LRLLTIGLSVSRPKLTGLVPNARRLIVIVSAFARTLRPGVSLEQFVEAWAPEGDEPYPAEVEIAVDPTNDRRVLTIIRFDGSLGDLQAAMPKLIHPQSHRRLDDVVESTALEGYYETADIAV
jgi:hypothetical protein